MSITSDRPLGPDDIFLWPDGFWCFREEFSETFERGNNYRVILNNSDEWLRQTRQRSPRTY